MLHQHVNILAPLNLRILNGFSFAGVEEPEQTTKGAEVRWPYDQPLRLHGDGHIGNSCETLKEQKLPSTSALRCYNVILGPSLTPQPP